MGLVRSFRKNSYKILGLNVLGNILTVIGNLATNYATLLAPIALVMLVNSTTAVAGLAS